MRLKKESLGDGKSIYHIPTVFKVSFAAFGQQNLEKLWWTYKKKSYESLRIGSTAKFGGWVPT